MRGVNNERSELQTELAELEQRQTVSESSIEYALNFMTDIGERWSGASLELKQAYQDLVFPNGFVYDIRNRKFITPDISPLYRVDMGESRAINAENYSIGDPFASAF